jgi:HPt (histidine-containing phosphotransfer) domain-containing protein
MDSLSPEEMASLSGARSGQLLHCTRQSFCENGSSHLETLEIGILANDTRSCRSGIGSTSLGHLRNLFETCSNVQPPCFVEALYVGSEIACLYLPIGSLRS